MAETAPIVIPDGSDEDDRAEDATHEEEDPSESDSEADLESETPEASDLANAISSATQHRLRVVLTELCEESSDASRRVTEKLLHSFDRGTKRRRVYENCRNCKEEYDALNNDDGDRVYHPGTLVSILPPHSQEKTLDHESETWADSDEMYHGDFDALNVYMDDPQFADGFIFECCDQSGDADGCKSGRHVPQRTRRAVKARQ
ncbi:hypothetical protein LTR66_005899 [Elasticomyces elasticus]|nr:hypothetical protein LTR66_005899 [Elasticomyces elasticus]